MSLIFSRRMTRATSGRNSSRRAQRMLTFYLGASFFYGASSDYGAPALQTCKRKYGHMRGRAGPALAFKVNAFKLRQFANALTHQVRMRGGQHADWFNHGHATARLQRLRSQQ